MAKLGPAARTDDKGGAVYRLLSVAIVPENGLPMLYLVASDFAISII
jgi:hypothetical protein